jgi:hypothetical protein
VKHLLLVLWALVLLGSARPAVAACRTVQLHAVGCTAAEERQVFEQLRAEGLKLSNAAPVDISAELSCKNEVHWVTFGGGYPGRPPVRVQKLQRAVMFALRSRHAASPAALTWGTWSEIGDYLRAHARSITIRAHADLEYEVLAPKLGRAAGTQRLECLANTQDVVVRVGELEFRPDAPDAEEVRISSSVPAELVLDYTAQVKWPKHAALRACARTRAHACAGPIAGSVRVNTAFETSHAQPELRVDWLPGQPSRVLENDKDYSLETEWASRIEAVVRVEGVSVPLRIEVDVPWTAYLCTQLPESVAKPCIQTVPWGPVTLVVVSVLLSTTLVAWVWKWLVGKWKGHRQKQAASAAGLATRTKKTRKKKH